MSAPSFITARMEVQIIDFELELGVAQWSSLGYNPAYSLNRVIDTYYGN
jgi:hypothetical protein